MRYYLDTEFIDTGTTIELVSIGIVCEDGRELYLQSVEFDHRKASQWVKDNVLAHLQMCPHANVTHGIEGLYRTDRAYHKDGQCTFRDIDKGLIGTYVECPWRTREQIRHEVQVFFNPSDGFELWGWCAGYDFVAFCQIFGTMMDLPAGWPHYIKDVQYILDGRGIADSQLPSAGDAHHALADAKLIKAIYMMLHTPMGSKSPVDTSKNTGQEWITKVLEKIDEVKAMGREPTKIIIPLYIQNSMASVFLSHRPAEGVMTFYGYPVEDGHEIAVKY